MNSTSFAFSGNLLAASAHLFKEKGNYLTEFAVLF